VVEGDRPDADLHLACGGRRRVIEFDKLDLAVGDEGERTHPLAISRFFGRSAMDA
jgi:hypothetical protein